MQIYQDYDLKEKNTFQISCAAKYFCEVTSETQLLEILKDPVYKNEPRLFLGGGSNVLFTKDFDGLVIQINIKGKDIVSETADTVVIKVNAGENWDELVRYSVTNDWSGLENLGYIPGNTGSAPIQNIGAYGVEVRSAIQQVEGYQLDTLTKKVLSQTECEFGYRDSIFKRALKNNFVITSVYFQLRKTTHKLILEYGNVQAELEKLGKDLTKLTPADVYEAVVNIRRQKLPDPKELGTAGSFFKNPVISLEQFQQLKQLYPEIPSFPTNDPTKIKIPAAWPIDQAGWKGKRIGDAGVHVNHALILVNYAKASGNEILDLAKQIQESVQEKFGITLEAEVNII